LWLSDGFGLGDGFTVGDGVAVEGDFALADAPSMAFDTVVARPGLRYRWAVPTAAAVGDVRARGVSCACAAKTCVPGFGRIGCGSIGCGSSAGRVGPPRRVLASRAT
jgi:hypothetical protein